MAKVELFPVFGGVDMGDLRLSMMGTIANLVGDGDTVQASYENGLRVIFHGTNLTFSGTTPTGGKVTGIDLQLSDGTFQTVANYQGLTGWNFADVDNKSLTLFAATPVVVQDTAGFDLLMGGGKADRFTLGGGAEVMENWGADTIYGGAGNDRVILTTDNDGVSEPAYTRAHQLNMGEGMDTVIIRNLFLRSGHLFMNDTGFLSVEVLDLRDGALVGINSTAFGKNLISPVGTIKTNLATLRITMDFDRDVTLAGMTIKGTMDMVEFQGNALNNTITGNAATRDLMTGAEGSDRLQGLGGRDTLLGGEGDDRIAGGDNLDRLEGGAGKDVFVFSKGGGVDRIVDFTLTGPDSDRLDLQKLNAITGFADLKAHHLRQVGADAKIEAHGTVILLIGVDVDDLRAADFLF